MLFYIIDDISVPLCKEGEQIEINTLDELITFVKKYDDITIISHEDGTMEIRKEYVDYKDW